jgi:fructose-1,6-bisphosphatase/inositol monophosphatase family enzyme
LLSYEVDRNPVLGVAYFPAIGETVWAETGGGCFWNGNACRVKSNPDLELAVVCHGGLASMAQRGLLGGLERLSRTCLATRSWCDAYGHALVATGRADAMIDPKVSVWDVSALAVIVREAGGHFTDLEGSSGLSDSAISVSPSIGPALLQELRT